MNVYVLRIVYPWIQLNLSRIFNIPLAGKMILHALAGKMLQTAVSKTR